MQKLFKRKAMEGFAIVTGSSKGLGASLAYRMGADGYNVVVNHTSGNSKEKAEAVAEQITKDFGVKSIVIQADVSDASQCKMLVEKGVEAFGDKIAVLVNNAGIHLGRPLFLDETPEEIVQMFSTNVFGAYYMSLYVLPYMVKQNYGAIVNMSSVAAYGDKNNVDYGGTKGALNSFTKCLALRFAENNIRVNAMAPSAHVTEMVQWVQENQPETLEEAMKDIPMGKMGMPEDVAELCSYLAHAPLVTGNIVSPSGGCVMP